MDVQPGHCWRCEKILPERSERCSGCPLAAYCTTQCRDSDRIRHSAVECQMFRKKKCSNCGKLGKTLACSACNSAWYCNADCQLRDHQTHKTSCQEIVKSVKQMSSKLRRLKTEFGDFPEYFGNTMATDFLQLKNNEWSGKSDGERELDRDYHVLSAGCGDLRNTVFTAASLPSEYTGKLYVTLNDLDPFMMARNVLFLFMLVRFADTDYIASSLTTIWYSLHLPKREYDLIKTSLKELIKMSAHQLHDATKGLINVDVLGDEELMYLRYVWSGWQTLECRRDSGAAINPKQQRKKLFENSDPWIQDERSEYLEYLHRSDRKQMEKWFEHGLFLPSETSQTDIPFINPTLTATEASKLTSTFGSLQLKASMSLPKNDLFVFRHFLNPRGMPFVSWDCLRVKEHSGRASHSSSWMVMYHHYVTNLLGIFKSFILQRRLVIRVSLTSCFDFPRHHQSLQMPSYDRIFTSNLADYTGFAKLLHVFKPLLNSSNSCSVIVTEVMGFHANVPQAYPAHLPKPEFDKVILDYLIDTQTEGGPRKLCDYYNSAPQFLQFLRADIMAGCEGIATLQDVPTFESVKKCQGMRMRDFQKELNKLVPFQRRLNVRSLMLLNPGDRAVEWLLPISRG